MTTQTTPQALDALATLPIPSLLIDDPDSEQSVTRFPEGITSSITRPQDYFVTTISKSTSVCVAAAVAGLTTMGTSIAVLGPTVTLATSSAYGQDNVEFDIRAYPAVSFIHEWHKIYLKNAIDGLGNSQQSENDSALSVAVQTDAKNFIEKNNFNVVPRILHSDDDIITLQWRKDNQGVMVVFTGDGTATYSVKELGGFYATNGQEFTLADDSPTKLLAAIDRVMALD